MCVLQKPVCAKSQCCICNRDFGVLLDVFRNLENRKFPKEIELCANVKVSRRENTSPVVCHCCIHNLKLGTEFITQFNDSHHDTLRTDVCYFCSEFNYILFDVQPHSDKDKCTYCRIEKFFPAKVPCGNGVSLKTCLQCAYKFDTLYDLREAVLKTNKLDVDRKKLNSSKLTNHALHMKLFEGSNMPHTSQQCFVQLTDVMNATDEKKGTKRKRTPNKKFIDEGHVNKFIKVEEKPTELTSPRRGKREAVVDNDNSTQKKTQKPTELTPSRRGKREAVVGNDNSTQKKTQKPKELTPSRRGKQEAVVDNDNSTQKKTQKPTELTSPRRGKREAVVDNDNSTQKKTQKPVLSQQKAGISSSKNSPRKLTNKSIISSKTLTQTRNRNMSVRKNVPKAKPVRTKTQGSEKLSSRKGVINAKVTAIKVKLNSKAVVASRLNKTRKNARSYACSSCESTFRRQVDLKEHELTHETKVPVLVLQRCASDCEEKTNSQMQGEIQNVKIEMSMSDTDGGNQGTNNIEQEKTILEKHAEEMDVDVGDIQPEGAEINAESGKDTGAEIIDAVEVDKNLTKETDKQEIDTIIENVFIPQSQVGESSFEEEIDSAEKSCDPLEECNQTDVDNGTSQQQTSLGEKESAVTEDQEHQTLTGLETEVPKDTEKDDTACGEKLQEIGNVNEERRVSRSEDEEDHRAVHEEGSNSTNDVTCPDNEDKDNRVGTEGGIDDISDVDCPDAMDKEDKDHRVGSEEKCDNVSDVACPDVADSENKGHTVGSEDGIEDISDDEFPADVMDNEDKDLRMGNEGRSDNVSDIAHSDVVKEDCRAVRGEGISDGRSDIVRGDSEELKDKEHEEYVAEV